MTVINITHKWRNVLCGEGVGRACATRGGFGSLVAARPWASTAPNTFGRPMSRQRPARTAARRLAFAQRPAHTLAASALAAALTVPLLATAPATATPVVSAPVSPVMTPTDVQSTTQYARVNVNVRSGPSTSYNVVGSYAKGTELTGTWQNGWLKVGTNRFVSGTVLTSTPPGTGTDVRYTRTSVNVRSGPSTSYSIVGGYPKGTKVTGTMSNGWLNLGSGRYIAGSVLVTSPPDSETVVRYTRTTSNVRSGPSTSYNVVGSHSKGTKLTGTLTSNGWLNTGSSRYVSGSVLSTEAPGDDVPGGVTGQDVLTEGRKYFGIMYAYGGNHPSEGFDCSGYTQYVHGQLGITLPRSAAAQQDFATPISNPQPGDLVFWGNPAYHVGIYAGDGYIYDSGKPGLPVQKRKMFSGVSGYGRVL